MAKKNDDLYKVEGWVYPKQISAETRMQFINDLHNARSLGLFEMRVRCLQEAGEELPPNIEQLRARFSNRIKPSP